LFGFVFSTTYNYSQEFFLRPLQNQSFVNATLIVLNTSYFSIPFNGSGLVFLKCSNENVAFDLFFNKSLFENGKETISTSTVPDLNNCHGYPLELLVKTNAPNGYAVLQFYFEEKNLALPLLIIVFFLFSAVLMLIPGLFEKQFFAYYFTLVMFFLLAILLDISKIIDYYYGALSFRGLHSYFLNESIALRIAVLFGFWFFLLLLYFVFNNIHQFFKSLSEK
jgi:hypothetical protein